jgi:hypothetical protein
MYELVKAGKNRHEVVAEKATIADCVSLWEQWQKEDATDEEHYVLDSDTGRLMLHIDPNLGDE